MEKGAVALDARIIFKQLEEKSESIADFGLQIAE
jgi:hypothetical protein